MPFRFTRLEIPDVVLIEVTALEDHRGSFKELYRRDQFAAYGIMDTFLHDNYSHSVRGVLRGLHFQNPPRAQAKLVGVIRGRIFDVAVDIRRGSPSYGRWAGTVLSNENHRLLYIPAGFAHGFCVLDDDGADVLYKATAEYAPDLDRGIIWNDPEIGIRWPIERPTLSARDAAWPPLRASDHTFVFSKARG